MNRGLNQNTRIQFRKTAAPHLISRCKGFLDSSGGAVVKNPPANAGDTREASLVPESERSPGVEHCSWFQDSCLEPPRTEQLPFVGLQRGRHDWAHTHSIYPDLETFEWRSLHILWPHIGDVSLHSNLSMEDLRKEYLIHCITHFQIMKIGVAHTWILQWTWLGSRINHLFFM